MDVLVFVVGQKGPNVPNPGVRVESHMFVTIWFVHTITNFQPYLCTLNGT